MSTEHFEYKLLWFKRLKQFFESHYSPDNKVVWLGDMNVAPEDIDVYNPVGLKGHPCFNDQVSDAYYDVVKWGFVDVFRLHNKQSGQYTFWDYRNLGSKKWETGWRIDHILATKSLAAKCKSCYVDIEPRKLLKPSDHTFLIAEFAE
jgi:exodeoxyribonuclease-3